MKLWLAEKALEGFFDFFEIPNIFPSTF